MHGSVVYEALEQRAWAATWSGCSPGRARRRRAPTPQGRTRRARRRALKTFDQSDALPAVQAGSPSAVHRPRGSSRNSLPGVRSVPTGPPTMISKRAKAPGPQQLFDAQQQAIDPQNTPASAAPWHRPRPMCPAGRTSPAAAKDLHAPASRSWIGLTSRTSGLRQSSKGQRKQCKSRRLGNRVVEEPDVEHKALVRVLRAADIKEYRPRAMRHREVQRTGVRDRDVQDVVTEAGDPVPVEIRTKTGIARVDEQVVPDAIGFRVYQGVATQPKESVGCASNDGCRLRRLELNADRRVKALKRQNIAQHRRRSKKAGKAVRRVRNTDAIRRNI